MATQKPVSESNETFDNNVSETVVPVSDNTNRLQESIDLLASLVAFDTTSSNSNLQLIEFVGDYLQQQGLNSRLTYNQAGNKANLWVTIGPDIEGGVVLSGHTDVVPVTGQVWSSDPFTMDNRDGKLYGRGTADMKGFVACALAHSAYYKSLALKIPLHFAFSYDEEVGCIGVGGLIRDVTENLPIPRAVIVGEPTGMNIIGGNKGGRNFNTIVNGIDGHSSLPELGANAIIAATRIINKLVEMQERLKAESDPDNGFTPPYTTLDLGLISGGTASNIIPARCEFAWGFRGLPSEDVDALEAEVRSFIDQEVLPELQAISSATSIVTELMCDVPALIPDETSAAEQLVRHLSCLNSSGRVCYGTEAGLFQKAGISGVIFGPGNIEQAHLPDEFVTIQQMQKCCNFLTRLGDWAASSTDTRV